MANNRIYLRCKSCGELLSLGKRYISGYFYTGSSDKTLGMRINEFYAKHSYCNDNGPDCFEISYEHEAEWEDVDNER